MMYLELTYTPEEAELLQHMDRPGRVISTQDLAGMIAKPVQDVEAALRRYEHSTPFNTARELFKTIALENRE